MSSPTPKRRSRARAKGKAREPPTSELSQEGESQEGERGAGGSGETSGAGSDAVLRALARIENRLDDVERRQAPAGEASREARPAPATTGLGRLRESLGQPGGAAVRGGGADADAAADGGESDSSGDGRRQRRRRREVLAFKRRLNYMTQTPMRAVTHQLGGYQSPADWPSVGTACEERIAPYWLPMAARGGRRLVEYSLDYRRSKAAMGCKALETHTLLCAALDEFILYDGLDVVNSAGVELMVRRIHGLERAFADVEEERDWKGDPKKLKVAWTEVDNYCVLRAGAGTVAPRAEEAVRKEQERRANRLKWQTKAERAGGPAVA